MANSHLEELARLISQGLPDAEKPDTLNTQTEEAMKGLFGERYRKDSPWQARIRYMPGEDNVPFAGFVHPESPNSGPYGGMSLIWFPVASRDGEPGASLITFVCGTRGLSPDEHILGRPGHARNLQALQRHLTSSHNVRVWCKHDPTNLSQAVPELVRQQYPRFANVFGKYGNYIYALAEVPHDTRTAIATVKAFLDLYGWEREWQPIGTQRDEVYSLRDSLRRTVFLQCDQKQIVELLFDRRFVILQGPPGTGKTRMADEILREVFHGNGMTVQFHPAVTYESFISGISPQVGGGSLAFTIRSGTLVDAIKLSENEPYLLHIDEINRADLGSVLGEAIYMLEYKEISEGKSRRVRLPQPLSEGQEEIAIPRNLYILGTMNSADRSIDILDLAVRRRFAFVDMWPRFDVVQEQGLDLATEAFGHLIDIFREYAPEEVLVLVPGHSYFLADDEEQLTRRLRYDLIPLLLDYIRDGRVSAFEAELRTYIAWLEGELALRATG